MIFAASRLWSGARCGARAAGTHLAELLVLICREDLGELGIDVGLQVSNLLSLLLGEIEAVLEERGKDLAGHRRSKAAATVK